MTRIPGKNGFSPVVAIAVLGCILFLGTAAAVAFPYAYVLLTGPQYQIRGNSMLPSYANGQFVPLDRRETYRRGDVIVFRHPLPNTPEAEFAKRIIGLPGETVRIAGNAVYVNGQRLTEPYVAPGTPTSAGTFLTEGTDVTVPSGSYIVMGDNRPHSADSREWGFIEASSIIGAAGKR